MRNLVKSPKPYDEAQIKTLEVSIEGEKAMFYLQRKNYDEFIVIETDFNHYIAGIYFKQQ